jgi:predicted nucleic acid-binding protein
MKIVIDSNIVFSAILNTKSKIGQLIINGSIFFSFYDLDDTMFVALNNHLLANLWTGDKQLINGLKSKGYTRLFTTEDLYQIYLLRQLKSRKKKR